MLKSINDIYRDEISSRLNYNDTTKYLSKLGKNEFDYVLSIMLSDLYKLSLYTYPIDNNKNLIDIFEKYDITYIKNKSLTIEDLLKDAIDATIYFNEMSLIYKVILFEDIKDLSKDTTLNRINKYSIFDRIIYSFSYDLNLFKTIYKDYLDKEKSDGKIVVDYLQHKLEEYKVINYDKYKKIILEFIKVYYKYKLYSKQTDGYLERIEGNSLKYIFDMAEFDSKFSTIILDNYLKYSILDIDEREKIDDYSNKNTSEGIQKKLKLNYKKDL